MGHPLDAAELHPRFRDQIEAERCPQSLYRFFDAEGALLYVGISANPFARMDQHRADKPWWHEVSTVTIEHHEDRAAVMEAEREAIRSEAPRHNIVRPAPRPTRVVSRLWYWEPSKPGVIAIPNVAPGCMPERPRCEPCGRVLAFVQFTEHQPGEYVGHATCRNCRADALFQVQSPGPTALWAGR